MEPTAYHLKSVASIRQLNQAPDLLLGYKEAFAKYLVEKIIRSSATNSSIPIDVTMSISQAHMGIALFTQQRDTSRLLAAFVYKTMIPGDDVKIPLGTKYRRKYRITDQREAQQGTYDTITNGVQSRDYEQIYYPTSRVVTMQFGCLLGVAVQSQAEELIARELDRVSTTWELTKTIDILRYCAAQPTLVDRIVRVTKPSNRAERLDCVLIISELMCGMVNIQPESFPLAIENARRVLASDKPEVLVVGASLFKIISSKGIGACNIIREEHQFRHEYLTYGLSGETATVDGGHVYTLHETSSGGAVGGSDMFGQETTLGDKSTLCVNHMLLGGGQTERVPIVHVDNVQMEHNVGRNTSTEHKAFSNTEGFKWEYFTVGCSAPALSQINPIQLLATTEHDELNYKHVAKRSPIVSYIHDKDGHVRPVSVQNIHAQGCRRELFSQQRRLEIQHQLDRIIPENDNSVTRVDMVQLAYQNNWGDKIKNPASLLEFDARNMVVPEKQTDESTRWLVKPRLVLFNSSAMNSITNELSQTGSELLALFTGNGFTNELQEYLSFVEKGLSISNGHGYLLGVRNDIMKDNDIRGIVDDDWTRGRRHWLLLSDPVCAIAIRKVLAAMDGDDPKSLNDANRGILVRLESVINGILTIIRDISGDLRNSIFGYMPMFCEYNEGQNTNGYPESFTFEDVSYCNFMYWALLPALGAKPYALNTNRGDVTSSQKPLHFERDSLINLDQELGGLEVTEKPHVNVIAVSTCVFSKSRPLSECVDASPVFGPTAADDSSDGFTATAVVTYMWTVRVKHIGALTNRIAALLMCAHYGTWLLPNVIQDYYDRKYHSGLSYLLFRGVRFTGSGVSLMQQKTTLYTVGTGMTCAPTSSNTHQVHTINQCCESAVIPETLDSPGLYIPNIYTKDLSGCEVFVNTNSPFDMVIADAFNGFCPESDSACGFRRPYIFTTGRSCTLTWPPARDELIKSHAYCSIPTLLRPLGAVYYNRRPMRITHYSGNHVESNRSLFIQTQHVADLDKALDRIGDPFKDTIERVNGNARATDIMSKELGVAFCGTYGVGLTSDQTLLSSRGFMEKETLVDRLAPRISGTGLFANTPIAATYRVITPIFERMFGINSYYRMLATT